MQIEFKDEDSFIVYYISEEEYKDEEDYKVLFKMINEQLKNKYDFEFDGFYDVDIYHNSGIYILNFDYIDSYGRNDFDVTLTLNSPILYEFFDSDVFNTQIIYYDKKYYTEIENVVGDIRLFEFGRIIFGKEVNRVLNCGVLIN